MEYPNAEAVKTLKKLGYPLINIRKALPKLTGISQPQMAKMVNTSRPSITLTINGERTSTAMQTKIADIWQVPVDQLFDSSHGQKD